MAPIPANIQVNFTSNYPVGQHRVCYRVQGSGDPYTCTIVNCTPFVPPGSQPCSASIPIMVDNETCDDVTYEGYVQATCEDELSLNGRIPFMVTFSPVPTCNAVQFVCDNLSVQSIIVTDPGSGYDPGLPPAITISGGGGTGATGTAVVGDTGADTFNITNPGAGYVDGVYVAQATNNIVGTGVGLLVDITISGGIVTAVTASSPVSQGNGYALSDTFDVAIPGGGGMIIEITGLNTGKLLYITLDTPGSGFSSNPIVTIAPGGGTPAAAEASVGVCPEFDMGLNCDGSPKGFIPIKPAGTTFNSCYLNGVAGLPVVPTEYNTAPSAQCCYECLTHSITYDSPGNVTFTNCDTGHTGTVYFSLPFVSPVVICAVPGSLAIDATNMPGISVVVGATCP